MTPPLQVVLPVKESTEKHTYDEHCSRSRPLEMAPPGLPAPMPQLKDEDTQAIPRERVPESAKEPAKIDKKDEIKETEAQGGKELLYRKIQDKLSDKTELYKLHLKHYHMSPASFKHRTSELHLSPKIYE